VSSWQAAYRGIVPDTLLDSLSVEAWTGLWQERLSRADQTINLVSVFAESVIGLITAGPARDPDCDLLRTQEVYAIYLSSEYWGHGHGTELYLAAEDRMRQSGALDAILWVLRDNVRAQVLRRARVGHGPFPGVASDTPSDRPVKSRLFGRTRLHRTVRINHLIYSFE
jgi:GNAT superfamily N-acetyltransferase